MKNQFRIGKLAQELGVKRFVIRFWEKEFNINPHRTVGGQRFYQQENFEQFKLIKELLYQKGFTIAGAKKILHQNIKKTAFISTLNMTCQPKHTTKNISEDLITQLLALQKKLIELHSLL